MLDTETLSERSENKIERMAERLQRLPSRVRWLDAQQNVIRALACGWAPKRGPRTTVADQIVKIGNRVGLARVATMAVNLVLTVCIYVSQYFFAKVIKPHGVLFVGIGAMRESALMSDWAAMQGAPALFVDETDLRTFCRYQRLGLRSLISEWIAVCQELWDDLQPAAGSPGLATPYRLSFLMLRGHKVIYLRVWFRRHLRDNPSIRDIGFSTAGYAAFAAIAAGASATYLVHGFHAHSLVLPEFSVVICFNRPEANHFRRRLPRARVKIVAGSRQNFETNRVAVITSIYSNESTMYLCESFIKWAQDFDLPIVVREHPKDRSGYWERWRGAEGVVLDDRKMDFAAFMNDVRPRIVVSWYSTTLCDAISWNAVPVLLDHDNPNANDFVFPLKEVALNWPEDQSALLAMIDDEAACSAYAAVKYAEIIRSDEII